jgi:hypothetical protein
MTNDHIIHRWWKCLLSPFNRFSDSVRVDPPSKSNLDGLANNSVPVNEATHVSPDPNAINHEDLQKQPLDAIILEVQRLQRRLSFLAGFLLPTIVLAGILAGAGLRLKAEKDELVQQVNLLKIDKAGTQQVKSLESQVNLLKQEKLKFSRQLKADQAQLKKLQNRIEEVNTKAINSQQVNENLLKVLKDQIERRDSNSAF